MCARARVCVCVCACMCVYFDVLCVPASTWVVRVLVRVCVCVFVVVVTIAIVFVASSLRCRPLAAVAVVVAVAAVTVVTVAAASDAATAGPARVVGLRSEAFCNVWWQRSVLLPIVGCRPLTAMHAHLISLVGRFALGWMLYDPAVGFSSKSCKRLIRRVSPTSKLLRGVVPLFSFRAMAELKIED